MGNSTKTEHDEVQDLLQQGAMSEHFGGKIRAKSSTVPVDMEEMVKVNHSQWEIEPNDSYTATGGATHELPAGVYRLTIDSRGAVHFIKARVLSDKLVDLQDDSANYIISGIRTFWKREEAFKKRGILYKRGILLWGPPGGGKTCLISQLMQELVNNNGLVFLCDNPALMVLGLTNVRRVEPDRPLIVVEEDIEEIMHEHGEHALLALLDGENQISNVVHIATTNYLDQLGARIVNRPSRFDEVKKIPMPNEKARRAYLLATVPEFLSIKEFDLKALDKWVKDTDGMSVAHLRELVVAIFCLGRDYELTIQRLKSMALRPKSHEEGFKNGKDIGLGNHKPSVADPTGIGNGRWTFKVVSND